MVKQIHYAYTARRQSTMRNGHTRKGMGGFDHRWRRAFCFVAILLTKYGAKQ